MANATSTTGSGALSKNPRYDNSTSTPPVTDDDDATDSNQITSTTQVPFTTWSTLASNDDAGTATRTTNKTKPTAQPNNTGISGPDGPDATRSIDDTSMTTQTTTERAATTVPPATPDKPNNRRPTTRIDTTLEMGYDTTAVPDGRATDHAHTTTTNDSQTSTSQASHAVVTVHPATNAAGIEDGTVETTTEPMLVRPMKVCKSSGDCRAPAKCVGRRCLTPCTLNNTTTTTSNTDNCFQGIALYIYFSNYF